ncbi:MAG: type I glyceraldehyde-3-phosphate dehydrogenase [Bacillota bacterium]|nr:type I glyceraldehyde-3-phosphate dehydrogenase [Bacillota bacterium]
MTVRVGINGFGSIGRRFTRQAWEDRDVEVVAVNDVADVASFALLLKYDSNYGVWEHDVRAEGGNILVDDRRIAFLQHTDPGQIPWREYGVDIVIESTGRFTDREHAQLHIDKGGARKVIISAPAKGEDITLVLGVNDDQYDPARHHVVSNASCTTNSLAPMVKVLHEEFGVVRGLMTTVHSYTNDQRILDLPHKDLRRARAGGLNIIPTSTGAARAIGKVMPELNGKLNGVSLRVPTPTVSITDLVSELSREVTVEEVNEAFERWAAGPMKGILGVSREPLVSMDYKGSTYSSIIDELSTMVTEGRLVKTFAWYDNEWGYSARLLDLVRFLAKKGL